jgi:LysM repeat protein
MFLLLLLLALEFAITRVYTQQIGGLLGASGTTSGKQGFNVLSLGNVMNLASDTQKYTVIEGDTLSALSSRFGILLSCLEADNPQINNPDLIFPGQVLNIPGNSTTITYVVQPGDFLQAIADRFSVSVADLELENPQILDDDLIFPGQVVNVPNLCSYGSVKSSLLPCGDAFYSPQQV